MTEKDYGGTTKYGSKGKPGKGVKGNSAELLNKTNLTKKTVPVSDDEDQEILNKDKILKAGKIASQVRGFIKQVVKKDVLLLEIAEKIEAKIEEFGGKPAFPTNLSINDIAAHYTPSFNDETKASGLLKVDFGVHVDGWVADTALSFDLEESEENKKLIEAAEKARENAIKKVGFGVKLSEIGAEVQKAIESFGAMPIVNLSGHSIERYDLHAGVTVPNYDNNGEEAFDTGVYAIEPFATFGNGRVYDGKPSGIYALVDFKNVRSPTARKVLEFAADEYGTLPFCSRWIVKKFGSVALLGLKQLEDNGNLHQFSQLVETSHKNVAQAEHTVLISEDNVEVTTK